MTATYIGTTNENFVNGKGYSLTTLPMTGRRYKDLNDREGVPDNRIMVWQNNGPAALKVYETQADIAKDWVVKADW